jgi:hypothetical protein
MERQRARPSNQRDRAEAERVVADLKIGQREAIVL